MRAIASAPIVLLLAFSATAIAADFDGSVPLSCTAVQANDCLPAGGACKVVKPESSTTPVFSIDFAKKEVRSPFRTTALVVQHSSDSEKSLVLQGTDRSNAWTARIDKTTGAMTITVADSKGAMVAFGQCRAAPAK